MTCRREMLLFAGPFSLATASRRRQCVVDSSGMDLSSCDACSLKTRPTLSGNVPQAIIVMPQGDPTQSPLIIVASRLVAACLRVLIVYDPNQAKLKSILEKQVASSVPCDIEPLVAKLLSFQMGNETICRNDPVDSPYDALFHAGSDYRVLQEIITKDDLPNVIVLDATNVGGLLLAEEKTIPSVMVASPSMLGLISEKMPPWNGIKDLIKRRYDSLVFAGSFMQLNKLRRSYGLPFLRTPSDYFKSSTAVLVNELPMLATWHMPPHVHLVSPLVPPCVPCDGRDDNTATIVVTTTGLDMTDIRTVICGLSLARAEFRSFFDTTCHTDNPALNIHPESCELAEKLAEFKVVWKVNDEAVLPELPPLFMSEQSLPALEIIASHPGTVAVISHCDSDSYPLFALGHPLVCVPTSDGIHGASTRLSTLSGGALALLQSTTIAHRLMTLLMKPHEISNTVNVDFDYDWQDPWDGLLDGGNLTAQIIQTIASASRDHNLHRLRELIDEIVGHDTSAPPDITFLLATFLGWNTILTILIFYMLRLLYRRSDEAIFRQLQELDDALYYADQVWWSNENSIHNRIDRFLRRLGPHEDEMSPEPKRGATLQHARRRRAVKKR